MRRWIGILGISGLLLGLANPAGAISFTTGFTFDLPETYPLHNVYVGVRQSSTGAEDALLPGAPTLVGGNITPAGFDVPVGTSSFALDSLLGVEADLWAVAGLFTDAGGTDHVVLATNADLTGVPLSTPLSNPLGFSEADVITWLTTGQFADGESRGVIGGIVERLGVNGYMRPFGETAQLFFFSDGQPIPDSAVTARPFGVVPLPAAAWMGLSLLCGTAIVSTLRRRLWD